MSATDLEPGELITDDWRIHGSVYTSQAVFAAELERVFRTGWLYVAHESQLRNPGDYITTRAGLQPVIVSRGGDTGEISVMLNRCRHRGATVCQADEGNANFFRCAYHGWTYSNTGELRGVTYDQAYEDLDKSSLGLIRLPRVESHAGFIFASFAAEGPSLAEFLGHAAPYLDLIAQQGPEGIRIDAGYHHIGYDGNWKLQVENTIDNYHFGFVHRSFLEVLADRVGQVPPIVRNILTNDEWRTIDLGNGHSVHEFGDPKTGNNQGQLGDLPFNLIVFPNLCFVGAQLRHVLPLSANRTEVRLYPMLHQGESDEYNAEILRVHEGFYGPAGMGGSDDVEIAFERVTAGMQATEHDWLIMSRGLHREEQMPDGRVVGRADDEVPQRAFYRQWQRSMGAS
ncbi:Rieske 2Fe-2S domain-containing protein [Aeromicrobium sp. YIM 150415]|uniref:aromatic ring-hydroxylating oxygenase subunit alpha n=1 Tax=Aeromicrobium sp. YIM 150415 TaxID=2803912 RepID=UPI0019626B47|nr:Rieske 2Fe-2S domain-containing protein [Aeromicrobium sp. YIM 150415]MBM9464501.1 Rieske 2Fe-2S domain-containing protein [Aeromicrobium sp. YIM 150415]